MTNVHEAKDATATRRRAKRSLTAEAKLQIWLELLSGESSQRDAAIDALLVAKRSQAPHTGRVT